MKISQGKVREFQSQSFVATMHVLRIISFGNQEKGVKKNFLWHPLSQLSKILCKSTHSNPTASDFVHIFSSVLPGFLQIWTLHLWYLYHGCHRSGKGQGKIIFQGQRKVRELWFWSGKMETLKKVREKGPWSRKIEILWAHYLWKTSTRLFHCNDLKNIGQCTV